ncbi:SDR family NAD(P)-dependent oxidoreductase [Synoicihabitans lomoniglobus]|uniref:SDR family NAD(P)-dependent oxidoreductase n=1 Tax=Synoicihabitans lomoniglobus TaxID=2909285 RepID=A0AAE9ZZ36_9BACT|nr:SDR family oxidoreductase [Opitutaceae bacterium LMO-M01]WED65363.1 SDR family NAD(P)-dependent oxidoreductase [Opitutaceae bacterium LMO-M01]
MTASVPELADQTAFITGGANGIGFAAAQHLTTLGVTVAVVDVQADAAERAAAALGEHAFAVPADVTDLASVEAAVATITARSRGVDILINCAGITGRTGIKSHEVEPADFERVWRINTLGSFHTARAVLPGMLARGYGRILHVASIAGKDGNAGMLAYSASKAAVIGMAKVQGKEYAGTGVTINALAPAVVRTQMVAAMPPEQVKYMTDKIPMARCGELDEIAALMGFIVSPASSFTTGFTWDFSGGRAVY